MSLLWQHGLLPVLTAFGRERMAVRVDGTDVVRRNANVVRRMPLVAVLR